MFRDKFFDKIHLIWKTQLTKEIGQFVRSGLHQCNIGRLLQLASPLRAQGTKNGSLVALAGPTYTFEMVPDPGKIPGLRLALDSDGYDLVALIAAAWADYAGCVLDVQSEMAHLLRMASWAKEQGGEVWVVERDGRIVGSAGGFPDDVDGLELKMLYVWPKVQGSGLGRALAEHVEAYARLLKRKRIRLWSDTRFHRAHRLYERLGYVRGSETRELHDLSKSVEYFFQKML